MSIVLYIFLFLFLKDKEKYLKQYLYLSNDENYRPVLTYSILGLLIWLITNSVISIMLLLILIGVLAYKRYDIPANSEEDLLKDIPIEYKKEDELGMEDFIDTCKDIIKNCEGDNNRIILGGEWGSGKTSIMDCIKNEIKEEEKEIKEEEKTFHFADVSPWSNDTKEKFSSALIGEIDIFCKTTKPFISFPDSTIRNIALGVSAFTFCGVTFDTPNKSYNKSYKIEDGIDQLRESLSYKKQKLIITVDDLDRLDKNRILDILAIVYLISGCPNIIFILLADKTKIEDILTEKKESCAEQAFGRMASSSYEGYLEKMASNIIKIPKPLPYFLRKSLLKRLNKVLEKVQVDPFTEEQKKSVPILAFPNIREIKRVLLNFRNSFMQKKVKSEVDPFHFLLVTILYVSFPKVYENIRNNEIYWIEGSIDEISRNTDEANHAQILSSWSNYFNILLDIYKGKREILKEIFFILNPNYRQVMLKKALKNKTEEAEHIDLSLKFPYALEKLEKAFYTKRYFYRYFTHNFSENDIPDVILDELFKIKLAPNNLEQKNIAILKEFIYEFKDKIPSFFEYVKAASYIDKRIKDNIFSAGISMLEDDNLPLSVEEKMTLLDKIIDFAKANSGGNKSALNKDNMEKVLLGIKSIFLKCVIYWSYKNFLTQETCKKLLNNLKEGNYSAEDVLKECFKYENHHLYAASVVYFWARDFQEQGEMLKERKEELIEILKRDEDYFWFLAGSSIYDQAISFLANSNTINYWGKENIISIINELLERRDLKHEKELREILKRYKEKK